RLVPRGHAQWPAGLFRPDGQYRLARPGPCGLTLDRGDGAGGGERAGPYPARDQRAEADAATRGADRHRRHGVGVRDFLTAGSPDIATLIRATFCDTIATLEPNCAVETVPVRVRPRFRPDSVPPLPRVGFRLGL